MRFLCTRVMVPGRAMGVLLYSKVTFNWVYNEILGFILEGQINFSVIYACSKRQSQFSWRSMGLLSRYPL